MRKLAAIPYTSHVQGCSRDRMTLEEGVIEPSSSKLASPIVVVTFRL